MVLSIFDNQSYRLKLIGTQIKNMEEKKDSEPDFTTTISDNVIIALRKIIQKIDLNSKSLIKRVGLTGPQLLILQEISKLKTASMGQIANKVSLSQGTVTGILERLQKRGLVIRKRSDHDRRRVMVEITESGNSLLAEAPPLMQESFVEQFNRLQDWEKHMILSSLQRLVSIMDARSIHVEPFLVSDSTEGLESPITETAASE